MKKIFGNQVERFAKKAVKGVYDEHLIRREVYNPNKFDLIFTRITSHDRYVMDARIPLGLPVMICKSESWLLLPHGYFSCKGSTGATAGSFITNYGDAIGTGNRYPSLPVAETR